ncbi:MAG TPA: ROK family protein [Chloroflexota bacterium]|nr:ROK family protein [Chloroflexota bacterium]
MATYVGLDFGGTKLAAGVADETGRLLARARCPTDPAAGPDGAVAALVGMVAGFGETARGPKAIGISFGGPVSPSRSHALLSHHGPGWEDFPLVERVAAIWGLPVEMDNDANACALGEARFGAGRGQRNVLYITVSTGIGGGVVIDGGLYRGSRGLSGEIGHTIVQPGGPLCACGKRGCLEATSAGPSIARAYAEATGAAVDAAEVFLRAGSGDAAARRVLDEAIRYLGIGLANAINLFDPDLVIVGGGVSQAGEALFDPLREVVAEFNAPSPAGAVPIVAAALGDASGILGAVALAGLAAE